MTSILTNIGAISALQTLRSISTNLNQTQDEVSTGLRVGKASDNAAYWSIATTMRSDNQALSAVQDALGLGAAKVDTAYAGMESVVSVISEIKAKIVVASESGVDRQKVQNEIDQLKDQLSSIASSSSFNGVNWLSTDVPDASSNQTRVVASVSRDGSGGFGVQSINVDLNGIVLFNKAGGGILQTTPIMDSPTSSYGGLENLTAPADTLNFSGPFVLRDGDEFQFDMQDGPDMFTVTVSNAVMRSILPSWSGVVGGMSDFWDLVAQSCFVAGRGVFGIGNGSGFQAFGNDSPNPVLFSNFQVVSTYSPPDYSIMDVDVTNETDMNGLLSRVDGWLEKTVAAAANLGAISSRISRQDDFANRLSDSIDKGVGRLVDADMNEASTRLKALQTQEQLAVQSLSIANSESQNIMTLFR